MNEVSIYSYFQIKGDRHRLGAYSFTLRVSLEARELKHSSSDVRTLELFLF